MTIELRSASRSDPGRARERNEDACFSGRYVFAVADGLGGHRAGEVASSLALEPIAALDQFPPKKAAERLADAVRRGNRDVFDRSEKDSSLKGMGTTMTAIAVDGARLHLAHVGDSRCYLIRAGAIEQVSRDHTLVARMVAEGKITQEQADTHPQRSIVTRALGADRDVDVDEVEIDIVPGDRIVLCSDGLTGVVSDEEIRQLASDDTDLEGICAALIDEANARGGPDNITTVIVDVGGTLEGVAPAAHRPRPRAQRRTRRVPVRPIVWSLVLLSVVSAGFFGVRAWADRSYYVGVNDERVVIYRGLPVNVLGFDLSRVEEPTTLSKEEVADWYVPRLEEGVRAATLSDARAIVDERIPRANGALPGVDLPDASPSPSAEESP
ncbi:MAG TPA: Stp1/IreP family PP2C-type Ser/Thr phosphatase [Actinomycetota bacterium]|nr:Stp1/IreP family PP2C-type Ser/Thr phosphatase [Actinomycetota bacterium]